MARRRRVGQVNPRTGRVWLGPAGELGSDIIIKMSRSLKFPRIVKLLGGSKTSVLELLRQDIYEPLIRYVSQRINRYAPRDTGNLRRSLMASIRTQPTQILRFPFRVVLNTRGVDYAKVVNRMPTSWLKHPGSHTSTSKVGKLGKSITVRQLHDPDAVKGWYNFILKDARDRAKKLFSSFLTKTGDYNLSRQMFHVRFY